MEVLVLGDVMLDIYKKGSISRISPEAPVPVLLNTEESYFAGGAANVAVNLASLGIRTNLCGIIGKDTAGNILEDVLNNFGVKKHLIVSESLPTITKLRVIGNGHHLVRIDSEENFGNYAEKLFSAAQNLTAPYVILSDYNKGSLQNTEKYIAHFQSGGAKVLVDPKKEIGAYKNAWFVKPNRSEFVRYVGSFTSKSELTEKAANALKAHNFEHLLITLGGEGMVYVNKKQAEFFPSISQQVADITGAGDTVLAGLTYGLSAGYEVRKAIILAQRLAELSVTKSGTYVVTRDDVRHAERKL